MHAIIRLVVPCLVCTAAASFAQAPANPTKPDSADAAWIAVKALATPTPIKGGNKTADQIKAERKQQADQFWQASLSAKDFCIKNPGDSRVPEAKKLEVVYALKSLLGDDVGREQAALELAKDFRENRTNPAKDRFEVAALCERQQFTLKTNGRPLVSDPAEHARVADSLRAECGDIPEVYSFYLGVVNTADAQTAYRTALKLTKLPAPATALAEARVALDRHKLLGRPLGLRLNSTDGKPVILPPSPGKITVIYLWLADDSAQSPASLAGLKLTPPTDTQWVYVAHAPGTINAPQSRQSPPFAGPECNVAGSQIGPMVELLKIRHYPFVYVLNRKGFLSGFGRPDELPALLAAANR